MPTDLTQLSDAELAALERRSRPLADWSDEDLAAAVGAGEPAPEKSTLAPAVGELALRIVPPVAAFAAAPVSGGTTLPYALAATAALGGEYLAQKSEQARGARTDLSAGQLVAAPLVAAAPLGPVTRGALFAKGALISARPMAPLVRGAAGATINAAASAIQQTIDNGNVDLGELAHSAAWGAVFGGAVGGIEAWQMTRIQKDVLARVRSVSGQWKMTDEELIAWMRNRQTAVVPRQRATGPAEEGAPVREGQIQPWADEVGGAAPGGVRPGGPVAPLLLPPGVPQPTAEGAPAAPQAPLVTIQGHTVPVTPEAAAQRIEWHKAVRTDMGPTSDATRWDALQNTYRFTQAGRAALPGVPDKDVFVIAVRQVDPKTHRAGELVDLFFVPRTEFPEVSRQVGAVYGAGFQLSTHSGVTPYRPKKGEPQYEEWLAGKPYDDPERAKMVQRDTTLPPAPPEAEATPAAFDGEGLPGEARRVVEFPSREEAQAYIDLHRSRPGFDAYEVSIEPSHAKGLFDVRYQRKASAPVPVETDPARRQEIQNSVDEGLGILRSGRNSGGRKLTPEELAQVGRSVEHAQAKLGQAASNPYAAAAAAQALADLRKTKPRPLEKVHPNPTAAQATEHRDAMRKWNATFRAASKTHKETLAKSNAWEDAHKKAPPEQTQAANKKAAKIWQAQAVHRANLEILATGHFPNGQKLTPADVKKIERENGVAEALLKEAGAPLTPPEFDWAAWGRFQVVTFGPEKAADFARYLRSEAALAKGDKVKQADLLNRAAVIEEALKGPAPSARPSANPPRTDEAVLPEPASTALQLSHDPKIGWTLYNAEGKVIEHLGHINGGDDEAAALEEAHAFLEDKGQTGSINLVARPAVTRRVNVAPPPFEIGARVIGRGEGDFARPGVITAHGLSENGRRGYFVKTDSLGGETHYWTDQLTPEGAPAAVEAPAGGEAKVTAQGPVITPTPAREAQVAKMADRAALRVQKEFLLDALKKAEAAAPEELEMTPEGRALSDEAAAILEIYAAKDSRAYTEGVVKAKELVKRLGGSEVAQGGPVELQMETVQYWAQRDHAQHVTIEVPDDGTFRIPNAKRFFVAFAKAVQTRMGKTTAELPGPFSVDTPSNRAPAPTGMAALKTKPTPADLTAAAQLATSADKGRPTLNHVLAEEGFSVATDGKRLFLVAGGTGKTREELTKLAKDGHVYNWHQVTPKWVKVSDGTVRVGRDAPGEPLYLDTKETLKQLAQARALISGTKQEGVGLHELGGRLGLSTANPDVGEYRTEGVKEGEPPRQVINAGYFVDALTAARLAGHEKVRLYFGDEPSPIVIIGGDNFVAVTMPIRTEGPVRTPLTNPPATKAAGAAPAADGAGKADRAAVEAALSRAYPHEGVHTGTGEKAFLTKAKKVLGPLGVPPDVFDRAVELTRSSGDPIIYASDESVMRGLTQQGWFAPGGPGKGSVASPDFGPGAGALLNAQRAAARAEWAKLRPPQSRPGAAGDPDGRSLAVLDALVARGIFDRDLALDWQRAILRNPTASDHPLYTALAAAVDAFNGGGHFVWPAGADARVAEGAIAKARLRGDELVYPTGRRLARAFGKLPNQGPALPREEVARRMRDIERRLSSAASPGFTAAAGAMQGAGSPPRASPAEPANDPNFTQLPVELPEFVQLYVALSGGMYPKIVEKIRALKGTALGVFRYHEGQLDSGRIELRADIFNLLTVEQKQELLRQAFVWAKAMKEADPSVNFKQAVRTKFEELVRVAERESAAAGPLRALATAWHEIGHWYDFIPQATLSRGNILGRIASLQHYFGSFLAERPGLVAAEPTAAERAALHRKAEKQLREELGSIVEEVTRTEPVYKEVPITPDDIKNIVGLLAREEFPEFYNWFARLDRDTKKAVLRQAMQGIVDERAKAFGKRTPTGETRTITEKITRQTGAPVTPAAIRKRFEELLRAELKARGLISEVDVRRELHALIAWWRGVDTIPAYFKQSHEMWADAMSVFWNNPFALAKRAPTFYRALMMWMDVKPGLRMSYDKLQADIRSGQVQKDRVKNLHQSFAEDEAAGWALDEARHKTDWVHVRDTLRLLFDRQFGPIERRVLQWSKAVERQTTGTFSVEGHKLSARVLASVENYLYRATMWETWGYVVRQRVEEPLAAAALTHLHLGEYMFHMRITEGGYRNRAAPEGWNPKNSGERLAEIKRELGVERFAALQAIQKRLRQAYAEIVIPLLDRSGVMSPALAPVVHEEVFYAPFNQARVYTGGDTDGIEALMRLHYGDETAGKIYAAVGNLGKIRNPYIQFHHRALGLISMAYRQMAVKDVVAWIRQFEPENYRPAEVEFVQGRRRIIPSRNPRVGTLYTTEAGVVEGHYVPIAIAEMFSHGSPVENLAVSLAMKGLGPFKAVLTELNPGFWLKAFAKDIHAAMQQLPGNTVAFPKYLWRAHLAARHTFSGKLDPLAEAALKRMMVISRVDNRGDHLGHADEMTRILLRLGKNPVAWNAEVNKIERVLRLVWGTAISQGQILERTVKIAGMMYLDEKFPHLPEAEKQRMVHEQAGSPNFLAKGRLARVVEMAGGYMFYNAWKESLRSFGRSAQRDPASFWLKFMATVGLAGAALWAIESGYSDGGMSPEDAEQLRRMLRSIPERDKLNGLPIVLGWDDESQGKVAYLVLPFSDNVRWVHALYRKLLQSGAGQDVGNVGLGSAVQYQGQDLPGQNPLLSEGGKWWEYWVQKRNPYDAFTGRGALDENAVQGRVAGGELAMQSFANLTGGMIWRIHHDQPTDRPTELENFLRLPVVSNLLGRWVRVSNRGLDEQFRRDTLPTVEEQARMRVIGEEMLQRSVQQIDWTPAQLSLLSESPYLAQYVIEKWPKMMVGASGPLAKALGNARTTGERLAILEAEAERQRVADYRRTHGGQNPPANAPK